MICHHDTVQSSGGDANDVFAMKCLDFLRAADVLVQSVVAQTVIVTFAPCIHLHL